MKSFFILFLGLLEYFGLCYLSFLVCIHCVFIALVQFFFFCGFVFPFVIYLSWYFFSFLFCVYFCFRLFNLLFFFLRFCIVCFFSLKFFFFLVCGALTDDTAGAVFQDTICFPRKPEFDFTFFYGTYLFFCSFLFFFSFFFLYTQ
jgi:hypothetical protein